MRVLIVEDNEALAHLLQKAFAQAGVASDHVATAGDAEALLQVAQFAAVILDLGLPDGDGLDLLRRRRAAGDATTVLIVTSRGTIAERVAGLRSGGDDYIVKPFAFDELLARVEAVLRRPATFLEEQLKLGRLTFDTRSRTTTVGELIVALPQRELELLELLMRRPGSVTPRSLVEDHLFGSSQLLGSNAVEVYVHRLRRRLEKSGAGLEIVTLRGIGYLLKAMHGE